MYLVRNFIVEFELNHPVDTSLGTIDQDELSQYLLLTEGTLVDLNDVFNLWNNDSNKMISAHIELVNNDDLLNFSDTPRVVSLIMNDYDQILTPIYK